MMFLYSLCTAGRPVCAACSVIRSATRCARLKYGVQGLSAPGFGAGAHGGRVELTHTPKYCQYTELHAVWLQKKLEQRAEQLNQVALCKTAAGPFFVHHIKNMGLIG